MIDELRAYLAWAEDAGLQILASGTATVKTKLPLLEEVRAEIGECTRCKLHKAATTSSSGWEIRRHA